MQVCTSILKRMHQHVYLPTHDYLSQTLVYQCSGATCGMVDHDLRVTSALSSCQLLVVVWHVPNVVP